MSDLIEAIKRLSPEERREAFRLLASELSPEEIKNA